MPHVAADHPKLPFLPPRALQGVAKTSKTDGTHAAQVEDPGAGRELLLTSLTQRTEPFGQLPHPEGSPLSLTARG